jgi:hypothetical protein
VFSVILHKVWRGYKKIARVFPFSHYVLLALLFAVGLELIFALQQWVILVAIVVVAVVTAGVILVRYEERGRFCPTQIILPVLATIGLSGFAFLLPTSQILHLYIIAAGLMLFFLLKHGAKQAYPLWNWTLSMVVFFLNMAFVLGLRFHLYIPVLLVLGIIMLITALMSLQALRRTTPTITEIVMPVLAMAFVLTEVVWALQFLPSHYLVQAGIVTVLYYVIFNLVSLSYARKLAARDIMEYVSVGVVAVLIVLLSARWT